MFHRRNNCRGITVFRWGKRQLELWFCPGGEVIEPHVHLNCNSKLIILAGAMDGRIGEARGWVDAYEDRFRVFDVPAGTVHAATVGRFCIFANWETWIAPVTSAATDFKAV